MKYLFISDVHLGHTEYTNNGEKFLSLIKKEQNYDKLFILGDFFDLYFESIENLKIKSIKGHYNLDVIPILQTFLIT